MHKRFLPTAVISLLICSVLMIQAGASCIGGARVSASSVNFRAGAGTDTAVKAVTQSGTPVILKAQVNADWYQVIYNGTEGFISSRYLTTANELDASFGSAYINGTGVRLRAGASTSSSILGTFGTGAALSVTGVSGSWYKVILNGVSGYVHGDYVTFAKPEISGVAVSAGQQIADTALSYLGYPYVYGGSTPSGFDCSGFVKYVYGLHGYTLDRTAAAQSKNGTHVDLADIRPGDIICFNNGGYIGHVGIYIGNNEFIHASTSTTGVIITSLDSRSYANRIAEIRRIV